MKASELARRLEESGTGKGKIDAAVERLGNKKNAQGVDLLRAFHELGHFATVKKAAEMLGLKDIPEFASPTEAKNLATRLAEAERERDELRERIAKLEVQTLGPKAV
jgi:hypothetical protein